jgi:adenosylmethionine-8-amino-7-oxononanoate aminotransferase
VFTAPFDDLLFDVARISWPHTHWGDATVEEREAQALQQLEQALAVPTAAVILEPLIQGAAGMHMVRPSFLRAVQERAQAHGALLIADEVMTGFGRTGALFGCQRAGLKPDLMALSKGLTGGFLPMGATMASERLYRGFISETPEQTFFHGHSFTANPLGCAAALASLDLLQHDPVRYQQFNTRHIPLLEELAEQPLVKRIRCQGTVAAFELDAGSTSYLNPIGKQLQRHCLDHGVYLRPLGNVVYLLPPLSISDAQLEQCYAAIRSGIEALIP